MVNKDRQKGINKLVPTYPNDCAWEAIALVTLMTLAHSLSSPSRGVLVLASNKARKAVVTKNALATIKSKCFSQSANVWESKSACPYAAVEARSGASGFTANGVWGPEAPALRAERI